jgi:antirestriction protein ArdC
MSKVGRRNPKGEYTPRDHYMEVTDQIIAALEAGTPPWRKPWDPGKAGNPGMPCNAVTGIRYRGINVVTWRHHLWHLPARTRVGPPTSKRPIGAGR